MKKKLGGIFLGFHHAQTRSFSSCTFTFCVGKLGCTDFSSREERHSMKGSQHRACLSCPSFALTGTCSAGLSTSASSAFPDPETLHLKFIVFVLHKQQTKSESKNKIRRKHCRTCISIFLGEHALYMVHPFCWKRKSEKGPEFQFRSSGFTLTLIMLWLRSMLYYLEFNFMRNIFIGIRVT